jgi:UDP-GlcNAc:undecaprenyl-phosphate GlcNAc-1-phosphate transferase
MIVEWSLVFTVLIAVSVSLVGTWLARAAAIRFAWLDQPSRRKVHTNPIPLLGGIAMYGSFLLAVLLTDIRLVISEGLAVLVGATILVAVGMYDDQRGMHPAAKLLAQVVAAGLVIIGGSGATFTSLAWVNWAVTIFWVVGICNAMNLLDNMDGLSAGVASITSAFLTMLALSQGQVFVSVVSAALFGATLGFLMHNWNPATIFMGDAGSLLLGFLLAILGLKLRFAQAGLDRSWLIPILVLAVPIFDTTLVTISRLRRGVSVASGGKDHVSHRLVRLGLHVREAVATIYLATLITGGAAVAVLVVPSIGQIYAIIAAVAVVGLVLLFLLERVDLADTGQLTRAERRAMRADSQPSQGQHG